MPPIGIISIPASCIDIDASGNTIWVHSPKGATILRIKTMGKIEIHKGCENVVSHCDIIVKESIKFCLTDEDEGEDDERR